MAASMNLGTLLWCPYHHKSPRIWVSRFGPLILGNKENVLASSVKISAQSCPLRASCRLQEQMGLVLFPRAPSLLCSYKALKGLLYIDFGLKVWIFKVLGAFGVGKSCSKKEPARRSVVLSNCGRPPCPSRS